MGNRAGGGASSGGSEGEGEMNDLEPCNGVAFSPGSLRIRFERRHSHDAEHDYPVVDPDNVPETICFGNLNVAIGPSGLSR